MNRLPVVPSGRNALLALATLAPLAAAGPPRQTCPDATLAKTLPASASGPRLRTPEGPPIPGRPFFMRVDQGLPGQVGIFVLGAGSFSFLWPKYGAVFYPTGGLGTELFVLNGDGVSSPLLSLAAFDPSFCGKTAAAQAFVLDPGAQGGVAFSNAIGLRVGEVVGGSFAGLATPVGAETDHIGVGDLNDDGIPDIVTTDNGLGRIVTALGHGDGTYTAGAPIITSTGAGALVVEDFDGDGLGDLALLNDRNTFDQLLIHRGLGNGTFGGTTAYGGGTDPFAIRAGDLDGDGRTDLVVANYTSDDLTVHLGGAGLAFQAALFHGLTERPTDLVLEDLDGDGALDVAVAINGGVTPGVDVLLGDGNGGLAAPVFHPTPARPTWLDVGDLDGDSVPDLIVSQTGPLVGEGRLETLLGNGDGTFANGWTELFTPGVGQPRLTDFDGDGNLDYVATQAYAFLTATGLGDGTFAAPTTHSTGRTFPQYQLEDLDGDGLDDVAAAMTTGGNFGVYLARGGTFPGQTVIPALQNPFDALLADMNGDRAPDLIVSNYTSAQLSIYVGDGEGGFSLSGSEIGGDAVRDILSDDFDGDGSRDLAVPNGLGVAVLLGNGDGTVEPQTTWFVGKNPWSIGSGDLNGDSAADLVAARYTEGNVGVLLGNGDGTFEPVSYVAMGTTPYEVHLGDLDTDGELDLMTLDLTEDRLYVRLGMGDGTFGESNGFVSGSGAESFEPADLNGDGYLDAAVASMNASAVLVHLGDGSGTLFPSPPSFFAGENPTSIRVGDFDEDGALDVVVVNRPGILSFSTGGTIALLSGAGDGTLGSPRFFVSDQSALSLATGDVDLDGCLDLAIVNTGPSFPSNAPGTVTLLINRIGE